MPKKSARIESLQGFRLLLFLTIFFFHAGAFPLLNSGSRIYYAIMGGGGTLAVAYFFVLSGFVASLSESDSGVTDRKSYFKYMAKRIGRFYPYHLISLLMVLPLYRDDFVHDVKNAVIRLIYSVLLLQSWNPDRSVWLAYNGVAWFLATSVFLTACTPLIGKAVRSIPEAKRSRTDLTVIGICFMVMSAAAILNRSDGAYWLYVFPPIRLLDYLAGYLLADIFKSKNEKCKNSHETGVACNVKEVAAILIYFVCLRVYNRIDIRFSRAVIYLPGALFTIWVLAHENGMGSKILCNKHIVKLGNATFFFMMFHQVLLRYASEIYKNTIQKSIGENEPAEWGMVICCLIVTVIVGLINEKYIRNILRKQKLM